MKRKTIAIVSHSTGEWVSEADLKSYSVLIGVDRGAFVLLQKGMVPDVAIGDFDSVTNEERDEIRTRIKVVKQYPSDKDQTDLELAVVYALLLHPHEITLFGVTGGRLDHALSALQLLERIHEQGCRGMIRDEQNYMLVVSGKCHIEKQKQYPYLSLLPATDEIVVSIKGCRYPLDNYRMKKGETIGVSNVITSDAAEITIHDGIAYCICSVDSIV